MNNMYFFSITGQTLYRHLKLEDKTANESLLRRHRLQMNHFCADTNSKWITTAQTQTPNESLLRRHRLQTNHFCADTNSKRITTAQTQTPNESLLRRHRLQMNHLCADTDSKCVLPILQIYQVLAYINQSKICIKVQNVKIKFDWLYNAG